ncbi:MAG TPA: copper chaperone PCu(A)C [Microthrixaceae bacterium]|nr:copper chaperone PCu(A)C [Microthrixaceae bacterium]HMT23201.1 copper chaperone PCu(A)C [Microthrixaceae bacterium]HMT62873.1 copper chaperone PCu(A)C [Microthrixaceae bacterium]
MTKFRTTIGVFVVGTALFATGCGDDSSSTADESTTTTAAEAAAIKVEGQWARTSPANAEHGAAYMMITATDDDMLTSASVDASVAAKVEIHETVPADGATGMTGATGMSGMGAMTMRPVDGIELPAGESVELKPGGYHVMLLDLAEPLKAGDTIEVTLTFEKADPMTIKVPVRDDAP